MRPLPRPVLVAALVAALAGVLAAPAPYAQTAPDTLTVVTLNIWHNQGDWPVRLGLIVDGLAALRPDVVLLQEVLQDDGLPNQAETIAARLGMAHVHFVSVDPPDQARRYGNAVLSRLPFEATGETALPPLDAYRTAAHARIRLGAQAVDLYTTHLHNPADAAGAGARAMEIAHLLAFVDATRSGGPLVLGGDFNAEPSWPEMRMLGGYRDLGGAGVTFGPPYTHVAGRRIDYVFDRDDGRLVPVAAGVALDHPDAAGRYPSDHFAVYARFAALPTAP